MDKAHTEESEPSSDVPVKRRYETRPTNEAHPARRFGLEKRTMEQIGMEAEQKRAAKEEALLRKQQELDAQQAAINQTIAELGALERGLKERAALEAMDVDYPQDVLRDGELDGNTSAELPSMEDGVDAQPQLSKKRVSKPKVSPSYVHKLAVHYISQIRNPSKQSDKKCLQQCPPCEMQPHRCPQMTPQA